MAGSIPQDFIREIVDTTDIVSLIDGYLPLKRKGKDHWGLCPFCDDGKHPSFSVSSQKPFYYCFKCRATGNVIGFDLNKKRINELNSNIDKTGEIKQEGLINNKINFTSKKNDLKEADIHIVTVPTPIDEFKNPNFQYIICLLYTSPSPRD